MSTVNRREGAGTLFALAVVFCGAALFGLGLVPFHSELAPVPWLKFRFTSKLRFFTRDRMGLHLSPYWKSVGLERLVQTRDGWRALEGPPSTESEMDDVVVLDGAVLLGHLTRDRRISYPASIYAEGNAAPVGVLPPTCKPHVSGDGKTVWCATYETESHGYTDSRALVTKRDARGVVLASYAANAPAPSCSLEAVGTYFDGRLVMSTTCLAKDEGFNCNLAVFADDGSHVTLDQPCTSSRPRSPVSPWKDLWTR